MKDFPKRLRKLFKILLPFISIIVIVLTFFWKTIFLKQVPIPGDFIVGIYYPWLDYKWGYPAGVPVKNPIMADVPSFIYPMQTYAARLLKNGQWPLWNQFILGGVPLLANFQSAPFAPLVFLYFIFDAITAWSMQIIIAHILAALFVYFLLREWSVSKISSVVGGIIFAFSGYNLIWSQWNGHVLAAAFIPLIIFFQDRWLKKGKVLDGLGVSIVFCFQIFSGYPQTIFYTVIAAVLLWLFRIFEIKSIVRKTIFLQLFFLLGMGLAATQLLTGKELLSLSQWMSEPHPFEWAFLPWQKIITIFAPDYFGNHVTNNYWGPQDYTSNTAFVGITAFILALFGVFLIKKKKEISYLVSLCLTALLISFPTIISIFFWQNNIIGMRSSSAHRALVLFNLGIALLSGFGLDFIYQHRVRTKHIIKTLFIPSLILLGFASYSLVLYIRTGPILQGIPKYSIALRNMILPLGILIMTCLLLFFAKVGGWFKKIAIRLLVLVMIFEIFRFGWKFTPFSPKSFIYPTTPILDFLTSQQKPFRIVGSSVIPVNLIMPYEVESLEGYETMRLFLVSQFIAAINNNSSMANPAGRYGIIDNDTSRLLDLANTKYYLALKIDNKGNPSPEGKIPQRFISDQFKLAFTDKSVAIMESKTVLPRAFMAYNWEVSSGKAILDKLLDPNYPIGEKIILEENVGEETSLVKGIGDVKYLSYGLQNSLIEVNTNKAGFLFISDTWYPGWKAYVDGNETKILRADYAFRAVAVPVGKHIVKFSYFPESFSLGLKISAVSLFVFVLYLCIQI